MGMERTSAPFGVLVLQAYRYGHEYAVFGFGEDADGGASVQFRLTPDKQTNGAHLTNACTPASSPSSAPVVSATWIA
jgi:hypothetical protein